jgi:hypothetical protein
MGKLKKTKKTKQSSDPYPYDPPGIPQKLSSSVSPSTATNAKTSETSPNSTPTNIATPSPTTAVESIEQSLKSNKSLRPKSKKLKQELQEQCAINRQLRAQLDTQLQINASLQEDIEKFVIEKSIQNGYVQIGDLVKHHVRKYADCVLKRKVLWGDFVQEWEREPGFWENRNNICSKLVWAGIETVHGKRKDWSAKMHEDYYQYVSGLIIFWGRRISRVHLDHDIESLMKDGERYYQYLLKRINLIHQNELMFEAEFLQKSVLGLVESEMNTRFRDLGNGKILDRKYASTFIPIGGGEGNVESVGNDGNDGSE